MSSETKTREQLERTLKLLERQVKFAQDILKANNVEEVFDLRKKSGLFKNEVSNSAKQKTIEEYKNLAQESIETLNRIIGENNGNN